jgi:hypothetical protein
VVTRATSPTLSVKGGGGFIGESLINVGMWLNDVVYLKRIRNFEIICSNELLHRDETPKKAARRLYKYWSQDPVHMTTNGYVALATALSEVARDLNPRRANNAETPSQFGSGSGVGSSSKTSYAERGACSRRQSWVSADEATAERAQQRGGFRGCRGRPWYTPVYRGRGGPRGGGQRGRGKRVWPY